MTGGEAAISLGEAVGERKWLTPRQALVTSGVIALVALAMEMKGLMVIPMTGTFIREAGLTPVVAGWVLLTTQLIGAATIGLLGRMGDVYGHRRILLWVLGGQVIGNALTGLAANAFMIIAGRALVGISVGAALMLPIMKDWMQPKELRQGIGFFSGIQGIGVSISFMFGGFFLAIGMGWRSVFLICSGLSLVCLITCWLLLPETRRRAQVKIDYLGAVGLGAWMCLVLLAISRSTAWGPFSALTLGVLGAALLLFVVWVAYELRHPEPLVNIPVAFGRRLLPSFIAFATMTFAAFICYIGITNFVQVPPDVAGYGFSYTVLQGGLVLLPMAIIITLMSLVTGTLVNLVGANALMTIGSLLMSGTFLYWYWNHAEAWQLVIGSSIWGFGLAVVFAGGYTIATAEAPPGSAGITNGMLMLWSAIGAAIGTATSTALTPAELVPGTGFSVEEGWANTFLAGAIVTFVGAVVSLLIPRSVGQTTDAGGGSAS